MSEETKEPYILMAIEDRDRYKREKQEFCKRGDLQTAAGGFSQLMIEIKEPKSISNLKSTMSVKKRDLKYKKPKNPYISYYTDQF